MNLTKMRGTQCMRETLTRNSRKMKEIRMTNREWSTTTPAMTPSPTPIKQKKKPTMGHCPQRGMKEICKINTHYSYILEEQDQDDQENEREEEPSEEHQIKKCHQ